MWMTYLCTTLLLIVGFLLIFIVLLQRGRGGGLAGAFGGAGGHSAFGTKAGDVFTKITVVMAVIWVALAGITGFAMRHDAESGYGGGSETNKTGLSVPDDTSKIDKEKIDKEKIDKEKADKEKADKEKTKKKSPASN